MLTELAPADLLILMISENDFNVFDLSGLDDEDIREMSSGKPVSYRQKLKRVREVAKKRLGVSYGVLNSV